MFLSEFQIHKLTVLCMRVCWKLYRFNSEEPVSDDAVQSFVRVLRPADQLRTSRLLYLGRLFVHGPLELLGIITSCLTSCLVDNYSYSWLAALHQDLMRIASRCLFHFFLKSLSVISLTRCEFRMLVSPISCPNHIKIAS